MSRFVSFAVLLAFIVVIGLLFYKVMIGFLVPIFLAAVLVVVFRPLHRYVLTRTGEREHIAAVITTGIILFLVLLPAAIVGTTAIVQGVSIASNFNSNSINLALDKIRKNRVINLEMKNADRLRNIRREMDDLQKAVADKPLAELSLPQGVLDALVRRLTNDLNALQAEVKIDQGDRLDPAFAKCLASLELLDPPFKARPIDEGETKSESVEPPSDTSEAVTSNNPPVDIIEVQSRAVDLGAHWQSLKESILGGPMMAILREMANPGEDEVKKLSTSLYDYFSPRLLSLTSTTGTFLARTAVSCAILTLSLFFFLYDGPAMIRSIMQLSPLDDKYERQLLLEFDRTARAVVLATILSAVVQGLIAGVGYYAVGMPSLILLILLTTVCALIPFVGPALVWVPVVIYLLVYREDTFGATGLFLWGTFVVGTSDNFVKMFVLHGQRQLHPLLALLSVLGGIQALGPIGILVGPWLSPCFRHFWASSSKRWIRSTSKTPWQLRKQLSGPRKSFEG